MSPERSVLPPDEFVLRRIHKHQVDAGPPAVVSYTGFRPTPEDTDGLSVYRAMLVTPAQAAAGGRKPGEYYVARLAVGDLQSLGLTVLIDERTEGPPGHALIPELSLEACRRDKAKLRAIQVRLAELASGCVVHRPDA
jgi:hypothetical protein